MTLAESPLRITMNGVVLLGFDDYVPERAEPEMTWQIEGESAKLPRAAFAKQIIYAPNAENRISFECVRVFSTDALAQAFRFGLPAALPADVYDVLIELPDDGDTFTLADARIEGPVNPAVRDGSRVHYKVTLIGGEVTPDGTPDYDLLGDCEPLGV